MLLVYVIVWLHEKMCLKVQFILYKKLLFYCFLMLSYFHLVPCEYSEDPWKISAGEGMCNEDYVHLHATNDFSENSVKNNIKAAVSDSQNIS